MAGYDPSDELFSDRLEESVRRFGVSGTARRFKVIRSTIYRWRTDSPNQRTRPSAKTRRGVVRGVLSDRRTRMKEGLIDRKREQLKEDIENAPTAAARKAAEAKLRAFEKEVESGEFGKAFLQQLKSARTSEDWKQVRASYKTLTRGNVGAV